MRRRARALISRGGCALLGMALAGFGRAGQAQEVTLTSFIGVWTSDDDALGGPARSSLVWDEVLGGAFVRVRYAIGRVGAQGVDTIFEGVGHYRAAPTPTPTGSWADSNGDLLDLDGTFDGTGLVSTWSDEDAPRGRTRYELDGPDALLVTDWVWTEGAWRVFNRLRFTRVAVAGTGRGGAVTTMSPGPPPGTSAWVAGIGGVFFRGSDPARLSAWYEETFGIAPVPTSYDGTPWHQEAGPTVFAPFAESTDYFGDPENQWMVNFRVRDLDALAGRLRAAGIEVDIDPESYPNGRFARLVDPEGNPIELWEPAAPSR